MLTTLPTWAEMIETWQYRYCFVKTQPGETLAQSAGRATPLRREGQPLLSQAVWSVTWDLQWVRRFNGRCALRAVHTAFQGTITLPQIMPTATSDPAQTDHFVNILRQRERQQLVVGRDAAAEIDRRLRHLPVSPSCDRLTRTANELGQRVLDRARAASPAQEARYRSIAAVTAIRE